MTSQTQPPAGPATGSSRTYKLGIYLAGVAIGLMFLGWVQVRKRHAEQAQQQRQAEHMNEPHPAEPRPVPHDDPPTPNPHGD